MRLKSWTVAMLLSVTANAAVNWQTGNYHTAFVDLIIKLDGSQTWSLTRNYDSSSDHQGLWGKGWGSNLDTRLDFSNDGAIFLVENGTGPVITFLAPGEDSLQATIEDIEKDENLLPANKAQRIAQLKSGTVARWEQTAKNKKHAAPKGSQWLSTVKEQGEITRNGERFDWKRNGQPIASFTAEGKLTTLYVANQKLELVWEKERPARLHHAKAGVIFTWSPTGAHLEKIKAQSQEVTYGYANENLATLKSGKLAQSFKFDNGKLSEVSQNGKVLESTSYDPKSNRVLKASTDGVERRYNWKITKDATELEIQEEHKPAIKKSFAYRQHADGTRYLWQQKTKIGRWEKSIEYLPCCSLPTKISESGETHNISYDDKNRLTEVKFADGSFKRYSWGQDMHVPVKVETPEGTATLTSQNGKPTSVTVGKLKIVATYEAGKMVKLARVSPNPLEIGLQYKDGQLFQAQVGDLATMRFKADSGAPDARGKDPALAKLEMLTIQSKLLEWSQPYDVTQLLAE